jgi:hypothetical protein
MEVEVEVRKSGEYKDKGRGENRYRQAHKR